MGSLALDPIGGWRADHRRFGRLLDFLEHEMTAFDTGDAPNYELMRDVLYYLHHFADRYHHPCEDVAFELIARRDMGFRVLLNRLLQEHRAIAVSGAALLKHLEAMLKRAAADPAPVEAAAALYLVYFRHHLDTEEAEVLPRAERSLSAEDWVAVAAAVADVRDPLFGDHVATRYRELREWITRED